MKIIEHTLAKRLFQEYNQFYTVIKINSLLTDLPMAPPLGELARRA
jgi:hypothetical protein